MAPLTEPCNIPRCALEVYLALQLALLGVLLLLASDASVVVSTLHLSVAPDGYPVRCGWAAGLTLTGLVQLAALATPRKLLHRWAAFLGFVVLLAFAVVLLRNPSHLVISGLVGLASLGEVFMFMTLRGAKWNG